MEITKLSTSYCVPKSSEEWGLFNFDNFVDGMEVSMSHKGGCCRTAKGYSDMRGLKKVSPSRFRDLVEDVVSPWRLEEIGFRVVEDLDFAEERRTDESDKLSYYLPFDGGNFSVFCVFDGDMRMESCELVTGNVQPPSITLYVSNFRTLVSVCRILGREI